MEVAILFYSGSDNMGSTCKTVLYPLLFFDIQREWILITLKEGV